MLNYLQLICDFLSSILYEMHYIILCKTKLENNANVLIMAENVVKIFFPFLFI